MAKMLKLNCPHCKTRIETISSQFRANSDFKCLACGNSIHPANVIVSNMGTGTKEQEPIEERLLDAMIKYYFSVQQNEEMLKKLRREGKIKQNQIVNNPIVVMFSRRSLALIVQYLRSLSKEELDAWQVEWQKEYKTILCDLTKEGEYIY